MQDDDPRKIEIKPGDRVAIHYPSSGPGRAASESAETIAAAMDVVEKLVPGCTWRRYPAELAEPTRAQAVVLNCHKPDGSYTGYQVHWIRR
jgi:hypothetical protein